jgi:hypothetical protein
MTVEFVYLDVDEFPGNGDDQNYLELATTHPVGWDGNPKFVLLDSFGGSREGGGAAGNFKMRGRDDGGTPGDDYITWISVGSPDFAGAGYSGGSPTPVGDLIAGSVVKVAELTGE